MDLKAMATALEATGDYRILRRMKPRQRFNNHVSDMIPLTGLIIDVETTGLSTDADEVIELGAIKFQYLADGTIVQVLSEFQAFRAPILLISAEITAITGITEEMVSGHQIRDEDIADILNDVRLVVAHNAGFDRKFCERHWRGFNDLPWACSIEEVDWKAEGFQGVKLGQLLGEIGQFHDGHRAVEDCRALLEVLNHPLKSGETGFQKLLTSARKSTIRIWATNAPFAKKDVLKARGYRWSDGADSAHKAWWKDVTDDAYSAEMTFLESEVYGFLPNLPTRRLNALARYSVRV